MKTERLQTVEVYDSFRPEVLLEVRFQNTRDENPVMRTFRSAYYSIRGIYDGMLTPTYTQMELNLSGKINGAQLQQFAS